MNKLVSVIIPTYSRAIYINRAIDSVLSQTYDNIEIIVVDDNGENTLNQKETELQLSNYIDNKLITYIKHEKNRNGAAARNTGIRASHGEYVTFLDDDDELLPTKIEAQVFLLETNEGYDSVYCGFKIIKNGKVLKLVEPKEYGNLQFELLACQWGIGTGSNPLFRRCVFKSIGFFDESFIRHQDVEFMVRFFRKHIIMVTDKVLINRYIDSRINTLDHYTLFQVKQKFLESFKIDINAYSKKCQNVIYRNQYSDVACHAMMNKRFKDALRLYIKANSYKLLSLRIIAKAIVYGFFNRKVE